MNLKHIRRRLRNRAASAEARAKATRYAERRRWHEGRASGLRLAVALLERREHANG